MKQRLFSQSIALDLLGLSTLLIVLSWQLLADNMFLSPDTNLRFIQIEQLIANGWQTLAIDYPLREFDPELRHVPYYFAYSVVDGEIFFQISPFFPIATAYLYALLGTIGLAIIPAVATVLTAVAVYCLARLANLPYARGAFWATAVATPLLFYSLELWDHTLGAALALWAVYAIAYGQHRQLVWPLIAGGFCLGLGLGQRPELYLFAVAVGLALLLSRMDLKMIAAVVGGGLMGAIPIWLVQWRWVGHPLGMAFAPHLFGYGRHPFVPVVERYGEVVKIWYLLFGGKATGGFTLAETLLVLVGFILLVYTFYRQRVPVASHLLLPLLLIFVGYLIWIRQATTALLTGILATWPLFTFALIYPRPHFQGGQARPTYRFVSLTALLFAALMLALWPSYGGLQWGSRYLLPLYPLLVWLALYIYASYAEQGQEGFQKTWRLAALGLLLLTATLQLTSVWQLQQVRLRNQIFRDTVQAISANIILTDHLYLPVFMASLPEKQFLYVRNSQELELLATRLVADGVSHIGIISGSEFAPSLSPLIIPQTPFNGLVLQSTEPYTYQIIPTP